MISRIEEAMRNAVNDMKIASVGRYRPLCMLGSVPTKGCKQPLLFFSTEERIVHVSVRDRTIGHRFQDRLDLRVSKDDLAEIDGP